MPPPLAERMEQHQVTIYLGAVIAGLVCGWAAPGVNTVLEHSVTPVLGALLYVTFLQVPVADLLRALRAGRFLAAVLVVNFAVVPLLVAGMFPLMPGDRGLRLGILLVLLAPCVDYVIVFSRLAGGSADRLLAATPLLLLAQMLLLPLFLLAFLGPGLAETVEAGPFLHAFLTLIATPLALAWATQAWSQRAPLGRRASAAADTLMVPLMAATLLSVVGSQVPKLDGRLGEVAGAAPFFVAFLVAMPFAGRAVARAFQLPASESRAVVFTGATRNGLVLLPLALALPGDLSVLAPLALVLQTVIEVIAMVIYVRLIPLLLPVSVSVGER